MRRRLLALTAACTLLLGACSLPEVTSRTTSYAPDPASTQETRLGLGVHRQAAQAQAEAGHTGIYALVDAQEAFAARALLARLAEQTLDVQYYIWRNDKTGQLLLHELIDAADRGVRVRLLLDDGGTGNLDHELRSLDTHPHIEVRLFNPFVMRSWIKPLGYVTHFPRTNRRMHNKSFTADNQASIVGGRNVGNEYFGATDGVLFADLDVLAIGPVVPEISQDFDLYWASPMAYPVDSIVTGPVQLPLAQLRSEGDALMASPAAHSYRAAIEKTPFMQQLGTGTLPMEWASTRLISDPPAKAKGLARDQDLIGHQMGKALGTPVTQLDVISPYFVPTQSGAAYFIQLRQQGLRVRILTNALESTDVAIVHSGYAKYRKPLLQAGVEIYEMRSHRPDYADDELKLRDKLTALGSSGSSLHAKTFAADGNRLFIGSFNFDPRSMHLNTEMGLMIDSAALARQVHASFDSAIPSNAYRLSLDEQGRLLWHSGVGDPPPVYSTEPQTQWHQRWLLWLLGKMPIEWLL